VEYYRWSSKSPAQRMKLNNPVTTGFVEFMSITRIAHERLHRWTNWFSAQCLVEMESTTSYGGYMLYPRKGIRGKKENYYWCTELWFFLFWVVEECGWYQSVKSTGREWFTLFIQNTVKWRINSGIPFSISEWKINLTIDLEIQTDLLKK
jgi:hypothetical protein